MSDPENMSELDAWNWLKARKVWQVERTGREWKLTIWSGDGYRASKREYPVVTDTDNDITGIPLIALVRLARCEEAQR